MRFIFDTINLVEDSLVYIYDSKKLIEVILLKKSSNELLEYKSEHCFKQVTLRYEQLDTSFSYNKAQAMANSDLLRRKVFDLGNSQVNLYKDAWNDLPNQESESSIHLKMSDWAGGDDLLGFYNVYETQIEQIPDGLTELYVQLVCVDGLYSTVFKIVASKVDERIVKNNLSQKFVRIQSLDIIQSHFEKRIKPVSRKIAITFMSVLVFWMLDLLFFKSSTLIKCIVTIVGAIYFIWNLLDWSNLNGAYKILLENEVVHMENMDEIFTYVPQEEEEENVDSLEYKEEHWEQIAQKYSNSFKRKEGDD